VILLICAASLLRQHYYEFSCRKKTKIGYNLSK